MMPQRVWFRVLVHGLKETMAGSRLYDSIFKFQDSFSPFSTQRVEVTIVYYSDCGSKQHDISNPSSQINQKHNQNSAKTEAAPNCHSRLSLAAAVTNQQHIQWHSPVILEAPEPRNRADIERCGGSLLGRSGCSLHCSGCSCQFPATEDCIG